MRTPPELSGATIVLLGHFNPLIFRPDWFAGKQLIAAQEADAAEIQIVHPDVVAFGLSWLSLSIERERFVAHATQEPLIRLNDLVLGCFSRFPETPITKMGINRLVHFRISAPSEWDTVRDILAPTAPWDDFLVDGAGQRLGGMQSLLVQRSTRPDEFRGYTQVKVEASNKIKPGIFIEVNDHFDLDEGGKPTDARSAVNVLSRIIHAI